MNAPFERPDSEGGAAVQQAETLVIGDQFLQIGKPKPRKQRLKLTRVPFEVSRLMEFCSLRELQNQTGHEVWDWPLVVVKELLDNALDAAEEADIAPTIVLSVSTRSGTITIEDNGPGISEKTIRSICDYSIRVSSREAYVSPTRGAQGNALKTLLAMGYVLDQERLVHCNEDACDAVGQTVIETCGVAHTILFAVDHVTNEPHITHTTAPSSIAVGTRLTIQ